MRTEVAQYLFNWNGSILLRMKNESMVVAVRTTKIAVGKKEHRADLPWPIHKGGL
jgi:hypothetical protein